VRTTLLVHILTGSLGLITGYVALYAAKGALVHRRSGMVFVYAMLAMCTFGMLLSITRGVAPAINVPAGVVTAYLVITGLTTVRPIPGGRWLAPAMMVLALTLGLTDLTFGVQALANGGKRFGMPAFPFFMFGVVGTLGALGDLRIMRSGALEGTARLARHLWRMCFALFIAALSFSIQVASSIPKSIRIPAMMLPMLIVLASMLYWLWRIRIRRSVRGLAVAFSSSSA
jgi:hypothetical protein